MRVPGSVSANARSFPQQVPKLSSLCPMYPVRLRVYTGICNQRPPSSACQLLDRVAAFLAREKFTLRSGASGKGELVLEKAAVFAGGKTEIYLPWPGYNHHASRLFKIPREAFGVAASFEPRWMYFGKPARRVAARGCVQLLGKELDRPSRFLICWTEYGSGSGNCELALRIASANDIPALDLGKFDQRPVEEMYVGVGLFLSDLGIENAIDRNIGARQMQLRA